METNKLDPLAWYGEHVVKKGRVDKGSVLLQSKIWGSHSHGTELPESDVDYLGVYVASNRSMLGMKKPADTITGEKPDFQVHEVGKFCDLLMKGNPGIIEMLFTDKMCWEHEKWAQLKENRKRFLSQRTVKQYLGYAQAQIKRLEAGQSVHSKGGKVGEKWSYHMYRVARDAKHIAAGGGPVVWKEGAELETLMAIRRGQITPLEVVRMTKELIASVDAMSTWKTAMPEEGDEVFLENWLLWVRGIDVHAP